MTPQKRSHMRCIVIFFMIILFSHNIVWASPPPSEHKPKQQAHLQPKGVTLIVTGLGLDSELTEEAIYQLPKSVVLSFSAYAKMINQWVFPVRQAGHEILLEIGDEEGIEHINLLAYFDGVLLRPHKNPVTHKRVIDNFLYFLRDKKKIIVEDRLFKHTVLQDQVAEQKSMFYPVTTALSSLDCLVSETCPSLKKDGIVTCPAFYVPFLIAYFQKNPKDVEHLAPFTAYQKK